MANRWEKVEAVTDFLFLGSKITADDYFSHEIKRYLLLGWKAMTELDSVFPDNSVGKESACSAGDPCFNSWAPKLLQIFTAAMKLKGICSLEKKLWQT